MSKKFFFILLTAALSFAAVIGVGKVGAQSPDFIDGRLVSKDGQWLAPVASTVLSSDGADHLARRSVLAWDLNAPEGTPVYPMAAGRVSYASCGNEGGYGCWVMIDHPDGYQSVYCHFQNGSISVAVGQAVTPWTPIGRVGWTGKTSFGPHVHWEIRKEGTQLAISNFFDGTKLEYCRMCNVDSQPTPQPTPPPTPEEEVPEDAPRVSYVDASSQYDLHLDNLRRALALMKFPLPSVDIYMFDGKVFNESRMTGPNSLILDTRKEWTPRPGAAGNDLDGPDFVTAVLGHELGHLAVGGGSEEHADAYGLNFLEAARQVGGVIFRQGETPTTPTPPTTTEPQIPTIDFEKIGSKELVWFVAGAASLLLLQTFFKLSWGRWVWFLLGLALVLVDVSIPHPGIDVSYFWKVAFGVALTFQLVKNRGFLLKGAILLFVFAFVAGTMMGIIGRLGTFSLPELPVEAAPQPKEWPTVEYPQEFQGVLYAGVYGPLGGGWGTLGSLSTAEQALTAAEKYAIKVGRFEREKRIVPVVNLCVRNTKGGEETIRQVIETCAGKAVVMLDVTPQEDVAGLIDKYAPLGEHVWFDVDTEHGGPITSSQLNEWAKRFFELRSQKGWKSPAVFGFWDWRSSPWVTSPESITWQYPNGLVIPLYDGHGPKAEKYAGISRFLQNYAGAPAWCLMEFQEGWGTKYDPDLSPETLYQDWKGKINILLFLAQ